MKKPRTIKANPHDPKPPDYGGHDHPLDYSDHQAPSQSILPMGEPTDKPPMELR